MNYYLICFNDSGEFDSTQIHNIITKIPQVSDWWHYLPSIYIIQTTSILSTAKKMTDCIRQNFNGLSFLVIKVDISNYNGVLNKEAWEWFRKKNNQILKLKIIPKPKISIAQLLSGIPKKQPSQNPMPDLLSKILFPKNRP